MDETYSLSKLPQKHQEIIPRLPIKVILFTIFYSLAFVTVSADDGVSMLQISKSFQPKPPRWSTHTSFAYCKWKGVKCNHTNYRVIAIDVSGLLLGGVVSPAIGSLPELAEVLLQNNNLSGEIPKLPRHVRVVYRPGNPLLRHHSSGEKGRTIGIVIGSIIGGAIILIAISVGVWVYYLRKATITMVDNGGAEDADRALISGHDDNDLYSLESLRRATNDFSEDNILGQGSFGYVYKGVQPDGTMIAVKRKDVGVDDERSFNNEISVFTSLRHKHLVSLLGFCDDGNEKLLVYEYMPNGTLADHLFDWSNRGHTPLTWNQRITIALDVARGIQYLHGLARRNYVHRDIKPSNVLIGDGMRAKISDFGCVRFIPEGVDSVETGIVGTFGYMDPHYLLTKWVTKKADVFAFGVILMGMITGRKANDETLSEDEQTLVRWLRPKIRKNNFLNLIDGTIVQDEGTMESIKKIAKWAEYCTAEDVDSRPDMFQTVNYLVPLVERYEPPREEDEGLMYLDTRTLGEQVRGWETMKSAQGRSTDTYGEPSCSKDEKSPTHPSTSGLKEIEMS